METRKFNSDQIVIENVCDTGLKNVESHQAKTEDGIINIS